jgi:hypothetical protein
MMKITRKKLMPEMRIMENNKNHQMMQEIKMMKTMI